MTTVPIQLKEADISKIDYPVKMGKFKSRNQAIRALIEESLAREEIDLNESDPKTLVEKEQFFQLLDQMPHFQLCLKGNKSIADLVSKDRDRFV